MPNLKIKKYNINSQNDSTNGCLNKTSNNIRMAFQAL